MFVPRRRPLMRAAMMGGAGYMAGKRAQRSNYREADQEQRIEELEQQQAGQQPAPPPAPAPVTAPSAAPAGGDLVAKLGELKGLLDAGALTQSEFEAAKAKVLQGA
ncbi:MAG TPA: SHOCT domain-containing protein [Conexibacter sp.]|nr:SHOCT domain-containing protein [Conexibacter sp.]